MRKNALRLAVAGLAMASLSIPLMVSTGGPSQAQPASGQLPTFVIQGTGPAGQPSSEQLRDIGQLAKQTGRSVDEVLKESVGQIEFSDLSYKLETEYPDLFVGAGLTPGNPETGGYFIFTEDPRKDVVDLISRLPVNVEIRYDAPWSEAALAAASEKVIEAAMQSPGVGTVMTSMDREAGSIVVQYAAEAGEKPDVDQLTNNVQNASRASTSSDAAPGVQIVRDDEISDIEYQVTVQGGRVLRQNGNAMCTSGFSAVKNGNEGLITANHCPDNLDYTSNANVITFGSGGYAASTDMQFHRVTSGNSAAPKFQADSGDIRTVGGISNPVFAEQVCKYGDTTGYGCTTIYDTGRCVTNDQGTGNYCGIAVTNGAITSGGDSGGPWFYSFTAKGTHSGTLTLGGAARSFFTQIGRASQINATVMTG